MAREFQLAVILHPEEQGGWWVEVPALPGCVSQGDTVQEALINIKEAIELTLECLLEDGEPLPEEPQEGHTVKVRLAIPV